MLPLDSEFDLLYCPINPCDMKKGKKSFDSY